MKRAAAAWSRHPGSFCVRHVCGGKSQRHGCTPQRLVVKWLPEVYDNIRYLHTRNANHFKKELDERIS